jgi:hypothetical protein
MTTESRESIHGDAMRKVARGATKGTAREVTRWAARETTRGGGERDNERVLEVGTSAAADLRTTRHLGAARNRKDARKKKKVEFRVSPRFTESTVNVDPLPLAINPGPFPRYTRLSVVLHK